MAKVQLKPPPKNATREQLERYLAELVRELEYILKNLDGSNMSRSGKDGK